MNDIALTKAAADRNAVGVGQGATIGATSEMHYALSRCDDAAANARIALDDVLTKLKPILGDVPPQETGSQATAKLSRNMTSPLTNALNDHANRLEEIVSTLNLLYQRITL